MPKKVIHKAKVKKPSSGKNIRLAIGLAVSLLIAAAASFVFDIQIRPSSRFLTMLKLVTPTPVKLAEPDTDFLAKAVVPEQGYTVNIKWGDTGKKLVESKAIDLVKFKENYQDEQYQDLLTYLTDAKDRGITVNRENSYFWVNVLWALGLAQKSDVLDKGIMGTEYKDTIGNFASTGGWTLGGVDAVSLFSSSEIIPLTQDQQTQVDQIARNIYRPCCGNPTSFPDCNHGMAILGLIELMVSQGLSEAEIYKASLAFNSYWFTQTYMDLAYYFQTKENTLWKDVDAKKALSVEFSSGQGYANIKKQVGDVPGLPSSGGSCGA